MFNRKINEVIIEINCHGYSAYCYDKKGYKTIWTARNKYQDLKESIEDYFKTLKQNFIIKKELSN
jgi:hypothetical protein